MARGVSQREQRKRRVEQLKKLFKNGDWEKLEKQLQKKYPDLTLTWIYSNWYIARRLKNEMKG